MVDNMRATNHPVESYTKVIDLNLAYERDPKKHIIEAYVEKAFPIESDRVFDRHTELFPSIKDHEIVDQKLKEYGLKPDQFAVFHCGVTWANRTYPKSYWAQAISQMLSGTRMKKVVIIGTGPDYVIGGKHVFNMTRLFTIQQLSVLIATAGVFVGNDSGMIHLAGTTATPIVGVYTSAKGEYRIPFRQGEYGKDAAIIKPDIDCYGCLHTEPAPVVFCDCRKGGYECLKLIRPEAIVRAIKNAVGS